MKYTAFFKNKTEIMQYVLKLQSVSLLSKYRGADKSLSQPGRKQATAIEDFEFHTRGIS